MVITIILIIITLLIIIILWSTSSQSITISEQFSSDIFIIQNVVMNDPYYQRLLMIEIINNKPSNSDKISDMITFDQMMNEIDILGKSLLRLFGITISQKIFPLIQNRNEIIKNYYLLMRDVICENGTCTHIHSEPKHIINIDNSNNQVNTNDNIYKSEFNDNIQLSNELINHVHIYDLDNIDEKITTTIFPNIPSTDSRDITITTLHNLKEITKEILVYINMRFRRDMIDNDESLIYYRRLFNLIIMYDNELINQSKSYVSGQYDISINCYRSSIEITKHISDELNILIKDNQYKNSIVLH